MKTTQAWGWLTAGVLALGLNGFYQDGGAQWLHHAVDGVRYRTAAILALASGRADQFLVEAHNAAAQTETARCPFSAALARIQAKTRCRSNAARVQAMAVEQQAEFARMAAERARMEVEQLRVADVVMKATDFSQFRMPAISPRIHAFVPSPAMRCPNIKVPVRIDLPSAGPV
jgi:aminoglycoside phosphotransferase